MVACKKKEAFTMIELIAVLGVIFGLLAFFGPRIARFMRTGDIRKTRLILEDAKSQLNLYRQDMGRYPTSREGGLEVLVKAPKPKGNWMGPYLDKVPTDAWGNEVQYYMPARDKVYGAFELVSLGPDGDESDDDIIVGEREVTP